ncbi:hypothetical protein Ancab_032291 [Ancistrocladus abbreviatus]
MLSRERIRTSSTRPHFGSIIGLIFAFPLLFVDSFATATISPGSILYASNPNQTWSSFSNAFSLHFISMTTTTYSLAITYDAFIPIWKAGGDDAVADASASFHFLPDGNLRLLNGSGAVLWQSNTANLGVSSAVLDDSGNFILRNGSVSVWASFDHPTDTLVPSQNFTIHHVLTSRFYSFHLLSTGNLALEWNNSILYWSFGVNSSDNVSLTSPILALRSSGILSLIYQKGSKIIAYSSDFGEEGKTLSFLKLDNDGNLRIYSYAKGSGGSASVMWTGVPDQCEVFGYCGNLGICRYNDAGPSCGCPSENFDLIDKEDSRKGCKRKVKLEDCPLNATLLQMDHTRFLTYAPETATDVFIVDISACKYNCLTSGSCVASTLLAESIGNCYTQSSRFSESIGNCYIKSSSFVSGYLSPAILSTSFVKVCSPALPNRPSPSTEQNHWHDRKLNPLIVVVLAVVTTLLASVIFVGSLCWWCRSNKRAYGGISAQYSLLDYASGVPMQLSYKELHHATKGGRRNFEVSDATNGKLFSLWAYEEFEKGNVKNVLDQRLDGFDVDMDQVTRAIQVSFWCIQEQPLQRPVMGKIVQMLEGIVEIKKPPPPVAATWDPINGAGAMNLSSSISALSTPASSDREPSSSPPFHAAGTASSVYVMNVEGQSSVLPPRSSKF